MKNTADPRPHNFLEQLRIRNTGPFQDLTIDFHTPVTAIAGPNNSGKTTPSAP